MDGGRAGVRSDRGDGRTDADGENGRDQCPITPAAAQTTSYDAMW